MHFLEQEIDALWPVSNWAATRILVAVSGGADSVALLRGLLRLSQQAEQLPAEPLIDVAHYNHGWRGAASDEDEAFVTELCRDLGVRLLVGRENRTDPGQPKKTEEHAREARYAFLTETAYTHGARYVVTGHTANDRVETVLHNLFRGSGLTGVTSPAVTRQLDRDLVLVRPLIGCWREQIVNYVQELGGTFREDASNSDTKYRRNYLRHTLLPLIRQEYGEQVDQRLWSFSELAEEAVSALRDSSGEYLRLVEALRRDAGFVGDRESAWFPTLNQLAFPWVVVREGLREVWLLRRWKLQGMSREHWNALRELMSGDKLTDKTVNLNLPGGLIARRDGNWMKIHSEPN